MKIDRLVRSRRKTIALVVTPEGLLEVRAPLRAPKALIDAFVAEKTPWIEARKAEALAHPQLKKREFREGETFPYLGKAYPLRITPSTSLTLAFRENVFWISSAGRAHGPALFQAWYRREARENLAKRVTFLATLLGLKPTGMRITSARTRWGSCSGRGNLNFTWRLVMAPPEVIDYVVIHELTHLVVKNHSAAFWQRVANAYPTYKDSRRWLKEISPSWVWM
jgi:predicted metal-dependent hydrolase